jgi:hypothetical protein
VREPEVLPAGSGASWDWRDLRRLAAWRPSRDRPRRPLTAALLSCLLPGAGQLWLGHRRQGPILLVVTALCLPDDRPGGHAFDHHARRRRARRNHHDPGSHHQPDEFAGAGGGLLHGQLNPPSWSTPGRPQQPNAAFLKSGM